MINKSKKIQIYEREVPLYKGKFVVIFSSFPKELKKHIEFEDESVYAHAVHTNWKGYDGFVAVFNPKEHITKGTIAHEASHLAFMICEARGVITEQQNDEPVAYLVEWLVDVMHEVKKDYKIKCR